MNVLCHLIGGQNGTIAHELGHAIGFWHEQSRPDRDDYVTIHELNVTRGKLYNFQKRTWSEITSIDVPYDIGSDMHYGSKVTLATLMFIYITHCTTNSMIIPF